jgi:hypothetical protein
MLKLKSLEVLTKSGSSSNFTKREHNVTIRGVATNGGAFWKVLA